MVALGASAWKAGVTKAVARHGTQLQAPYLYGYELQALEGQHGCGLAQVGVEVHTAKCAARAPWLHGFRTTVACRMNDLFRDTIQDKLRPPGSQTCHTTVLPEPKPARGGELGMYGRAGAARSKPYACTVRRLSGSRWATDLRYPFLCEGLDLWREIRNKRHVLIYFCGLAVSHVARAVTVRVCDVTASRKSVSPDVREGSCGFEQV